VAEIFMDSTYHIDFSSSFYNDLSYFFANVDPEGKVLPDSKNRDFGEKLIVNQLKILRCHEPWSTRVRLSTVDSLINVSRFVPKVNNIFNMKSS
jgi:hypothetical protein